MTNEYFLDSLWLHWEAISREEKWQDQLRGYFLMKTNRSTWKISQVITRKFHNLTSKFENLIYLINVCATSWAAQQAIMWQTQWAITAVFLNLSTNKINIWEGSKKRNACVGSSWCTSCETSITSSNHKIIVLFLLQSQKRKWNLEKMTVKRSSRTWHQSAFSVLRSEIFNNVEEILSFAFRELRLSWDIYS